MAETRTVQCQKCGDKFEVPVRMTAKKGKQWETTQLNGRTCAECTEKNYRKLIKKHSRRLRVGSRSLSTTRRLVDIAKAMGISLDRAEVIERRAMAKIREHPELRELFERWLEEGGGVPAMEPPKPPPPMEETGKQIVDYLLELSRWYQVEDNLLSRGRRKDALECRREIERAHQTLKTQLAEMNLTTE